MSGSDKTLEQIERENESLRCRIVELERDRTEERRMEERLRRLATVLIDSNDAITLLDLTGRIVAWNRGAERMYGWTEAEALQMNVRELVPKAKIKEMDSFLESIRAGEVVESFETQRMTKDDRLLDVWVTVTKLVDEVGRPVAIAKTERDITDRKRAEERLQREVDALARSNKELEQFAYVASHDLQEPLRMVASFTQLLAQKYEGQLDDKARKYIDYAVDGAVRMQRLINDLLTYSRIGTQGKPPEPTDSHAVLDETLRNLQAAIQENRAIVTNDDLPTVHVDASQLLQLFQNLVGNAVKFHGADPPRIHVSARDLGREWVFSVKDNGIGIEPQYADRIFVIFQRLHTRDEYPGTGIGLALCKRIVDRHGGRIWFESEPGKGSTFFFTVPKRERSDFQ